MFGHICRSFRRTALAAMVMFPLLWSGNPARADVVTINFLDGVYQSSHNNGVTTQPYDTYVESGFSFKTPQAPGQHLDWEPGVLFWHEGPSNTVNNVITLSYAGGVFNLLGFDLVALPNNTLSNFNYAMTVTGSNGSSYITYDNAVATFNLGWTGLDWVTFDINTQNSGGEWMDNVVVQTVAVPEPASLALLGIGLAGLGFSRRKKHEQAA